MQLLALLNLQEILAHEKSPTWTYMFLYGEIDVKFNEQIQNNVLPSERISRGRLRP